MVINSRWGAADTRKIGMPKNDHKNAYQTKEPWKDTVWSEIFADLASVQSHVAGLC